MSLTMREVVPVKSILKRLNKKYRFELSESSTVVREGVAVTVDGQVLRVREVGIG